MALVQGKEILRKAVEGNYAVPAFGFVNMEGAKAIIEAAEQLNSPVILQTTQGGIDYADHELLAAIAIALAKKSKVPVAIHLDHGREISYHEKALELGYTSLMIDGSHLPFEENVKLTNIVKEMVEGTEIMVEAELGQIGGKEDDIEEEGSQYTTVEEAVEFVNQTHPDALAIACGTAHGFYTKEPKLNFDVIKNIREATNTPLVLHGGTGVPLEQITQAVELGMNKVNFDSELKQAFIKSVVEYMDQNPKAYDIRKIFRPGIDSQVEVAKQKIIAVKSNDKNWL